MKIRTNMGNFPKAAINKGNRKCILDMQPEIAYSNNEL